MLPSRSEILAKAISLYEISAWTDKSDFMDEICPKGISVKNRKKVYITIELSIFELF